MAVFKVETKNKVDIDKKPRVYFTCHPDDFERYFKKICDDIFKTHDCAVYYTENMNEVIAEDEKKTDLGRHNLFVVPVTYRLLSTPNRAMDEDIPYALKEHIPVLPIMMESGFDELYSKPDKFGELQYLNPYSTDLTEISYEEKLKKYLESVLISDELAKRVRAAFDAYIFLSYRKKDRKYANELMRLIHSNPECRDIAIWFDEFLTPGESFKENIEKILDDCKLFTLLVTPQLLEKVVDKNGEERDNYVISTELPLARKKKEEKGTDIFAVEMEKTDREALSAISIEDYTNPENADFRARLLETISRMAITTNNTPEHNFLIGLAYLEGIDVEVNRERAVKLITSAAETELPEAIAKLISMYIDGIGVSRNQKEAQKWSERLAEYYFERSFSKKGAIKSKKKIYELFSNYKNKYYAETIKSFLVYADKRLPFDAIKTLYELLMSIGICEYTLLFDACNNMLQYQKETQIILVTDILTKSVDGTYPPYGPLFWYVPEHRLYEELILALETMKHKDFFTKTLALTRDVCWIFGHYNTINEITNRVNGKTLFNQASLTGVRYGLCELFFIGETGFSDGGDIYPRCFNVAEAKEFKNTGCGIHGIMKTAFVDELNLYSHSSRPIVDEECIGIISSEYFKYKIENDLSSISCKKIRGLFLAPTNDNKLDFISFNRSNIEIIYIPENIIEFEKDWDKHTHIRQNICKTSTGFTYWRKILMFPDDKKTISNNSYMLYGSTGTEFDLFIPESIIIIEREAFSKTLGLKNVHIEGAHSIGQMAFCDCPDLITVKLPDRLNKIGGRAFANCSNLTKINLPNQLECINPGLFSECHSLEEILIPECTKEIKGGAFQGCVKLQKIHLPETIDIIGVSAFSGCISLKNINIPHKLKKIERNCFENCASLQSLFLPEEITEIEEYAFCGCKNIQTVNFSNSINKINEFAFAMCTSLSCIEICVQNISIGLCAFAGCSKLINIDISANRIDIDEFAFAKCEGLKSIRIPAHSSFSQNTFAFCPKISNSYLCKSLNKFSSSAAMALMELFSLLPKSNSHSISTCESKNDELCFDTENTINISLQKTILSIPCGTEKINSEDYCRRDDFTQVQIPDTVIEIGENAFRDCVNLEEIFIPDCVLEIGPSAFEDCHKLKKVRLPSKLMDLNAFVFCDCSSLEDLVMPEYLLEIGELTFAGCSSLRRISIPQSVRDIGTHAFIDCSSLEEIYIGQRFEGDIQRIFGDVNLAIVTFI